MLHVQKPAGRPMLIPPLLPPCHQVVTELRPSVFVFNAGLHRPFLRMPVWSQNVTDSILAAAAAAVAPQGGTCIWKTTTASKDGHVPHAMDANVLARTTAHGFAVMDAWAATSGLLALDPPAYWDHNHFVGFVYTELNHFLLNMLCPP